MDRPRKPRRKRYEVSGPPEWRTAKPGKLPLPTPRGRNKNYGSKRWSWPMSQERLDAWRAKRAGEYAAANPEQLDMFRHTLAALDAAEGGAPLEPPAPVWPKPRKRRRSARGL